MMVWWRFLNDCFEMQKILLTDTLYEREVEKVFTDYQTHYLLRNNEIAYFEKRLLNDKQQLNSSICATSCCLLAAINLWA